MASLIPMSPTTTIQVFRGKYFFLSNFYPCQISWCHQLYRSVEHAYQASKTLDQRARLAIQDAITAADAKALGSDPAKTPLRRDWLKLKREFMERMQGKKYEHRYLRHLLLETADAYLIEGNHWHDTFFGQCFCPTHQGAGDNHLGRILMRLRAELTE